MRFVSLRDVSGATLRQNKQGFHVRGGRINLACMGIRESLCLTLQEIFSASQMSPKLTEESSPQIVFCAANGIDAVVAIVDHVCVQPSLCVMELCVVRESAENCHQPC